jgi:HEAT repeats
MCLDSNLTKLIALSVVFGYGGVSMANSSNQDQCVAAIKSLSSSTERDRSEGIKQIQQLGRAAIEPLVSLLSDLVHNQRPRFPVDKTEEGAGALREYVTAVRAFSKGTGVSYDEVKVASARLAAVAINTRLMTDVVQLLGRLRAEPAIPILIEIMNKHYGIGGLGGCERDALSQIGEAAVPDLIKDLEESNICAYGFDRVIYGFSFVVEAAEDEASDADDEENEDLSETYESQLSLIRQRVVWVLGEIGSQRSLPALHKLLDATHDEFLRVRIEHALGKIQKNGPNDPGVPQSLPRPSPPRTRE